MSAPMCDLCGFWVATHGDYCELCAADALPQVCWCEHRMRPQPIAAIHAGRGWSCSPQCRPGCQPGVGKPKSGPKRKEAA